MEINGIKIQEGFLVQSSYLPHGSNQEEFNSFHKVANCDDGQVYIELPKRLAKENRGWNYKSWCDESWCDEGKKYWMIAWPEQIMQIKGYFSND